MAAEHIRETGTGKNYAADLITDGGVADGGLALDVFVQRIKMGFGDNHFYSDVSSSNPLPTRDYNTEVSLGNVPGRSYVQISGHNPAVGTSFEDVWDPGGTLVYPTTGESWEIVSDNVNDTSGGTGARTIAVTYIDFTTRSEVTETLTMNGTTAVAFTTSTAYRFQIAAVLTVGSAGWNLGAITIRIASGGATRGGISFSTVDSRGPNVSRGTHYTVPAGFSAIPEGITANVSKNHDATIAAIVRVGGVGPEFLIGERNNYQDSFQDSFSDAPVAVSEKTDIKVIGKSNNTEVPINIEIFFQLVEN